MSDNGRLFLPAFSDLEQTLVRLSAKDRMRNANHVGT